MNWFKKIRGILGYFWCLFWDDSWLVLLIIKIYKFIIGLSIESRLQQICKQTSVFQAILSDYIYPIKVLIARQPNQNIIDVSLFSVGTSNIGESDSGFLYDVYTQLTPDVQGFKVSVESQRIDFDFSYYTDSKKLFSSIDLLKAGFTPSLLNVNGQPAECLVLWADYNEYRTLRDNFSWALLLPINWIYKYPGIMSVAWTIKHTGATVLLVKDFFSKMGIESQVYLGRTGLPASNILPGIYVMTEPGYLYADNILSTSLYSDCLPLKTTPGGAVSSVYVTKCHLRLQQQVDIYVELPTSLNPAKYVFLLLWGASAGLVLLDSNSGKEDVLIAVRFIAKNVVKGAILQIYGKGESNSLSLLYPDKEYALTLLSYYNNSINNTLEQVVVASDSQSSSSGQGSSSGSGSSTDIGKLYAFTSIPSDSGTWQFVNEGWSHFYVLHDKSDSRSDINTMRVSAVASSDSNWLLKYEAWPKFYIMRKLK